MRAVDDESIDTVVSDKQRQNLQLDIDLFRLHEVFVGEVGRASNRDILEDDADPSPEGNIEPFDLHRAIEGGTSLLFGECAHFLSREEQLEADHRQKHQGDQDADYPGDDLAEFLHGSPFYTEFSFRPYTERRLFGWQQKHIPCTFIPDNAKNDAKCGRIVGSRQAR